MFGGKVRFVSFESGDAAQRGERENDNVRQPNKPKDNFLRLKFTVIAKSVSFEVDFAMG